MTPLRWTREAPKEAGWWWMKDTNGALCPVEVRIVEGFPNAVGGIFSVQIDLMRGVLWSTAPIAPPEEGS